MKKVRRERAILKKAAAMLVIPCLILANTTVSSANGEVSSKETHCGFEEHQHDDTCIGEQVLVCGYDREAASAEGEATGHIHDEGCFELQNVLTCTLAEHLHSPESGCYDAEGNLICEIPQHIHSEEEGCYTAMQVLICSLSETPAGNSGSEGANAEGHVHTDSCYKVTYTCGKEEHRHSLACYSDPEADTETAADWERTVAYTELTGDFAVDLISVAKTQLDYSESVDNYSVVLDDQGNETEKINGYTRYGAWYGDAYGEWSAMFVSFCMYYAGITAEMIPYSSSCSDWVRTFSEAGLYEPVYIETTDENGIPVLVRNDYTPEMGDIIFFDRDGDGAADHAGIVEEMEIPGSENNEGVISDKYKVHTIEGDSKGKVVLGSYDPEDNSILGYCSLYRAYVSAVDRGLIEGVRHLTAQAGDGAVFSAIGKLPEGAELCVAPLTEEELAIIKSRYSMTGTFYDIKIIADGQKYRPESPIRISVSGLDMDAGTDSEGCHLDVDAEELDRAPQDVDISPVEEENTGNRITFEAESFSIYGLGTTLLTAESAGHPALSYIPDGYRAYMEYTLPGDYYSSANTSYTYGVLRQTVLYVYAQAGEKICLGSDIYNSIIDADEIKTSSETGVDIVLIDPSGNKYTFDTVLNGKGYIGTRQQETYGANFDGTNSNGYTPHMITAPVTGIYEVRFHSYSGDRGTKAVSTAHQQNATDPKGIICTSDSWLNSPVTVGAYDITVVNNGTVQTGRAFAEYLALNIGANKVNYNMNKYVVTEDGYIYNVDAEIDPYGFIFFGNNRGIIDNETDDSAYHSYKGKNNNSTLEDINISIHNPMDPDTAADQTYRIFFEEPDPILETIVFKKAFVPEHITEIEFVGAKEGNVTYVGNGGYFKFEVENANSISIVINFDKYNEAMGLEGDEAYQAVTLTSHVAQGTNYVYWDGNDALGRVLPAAYYSDNYVDITVQTHAGEFHFAFLDVENSTYTTVERINKIYDYDSDGTLIDVTESYEDSKYTIYYNNAAGGYKYNKLNGGAIANGYDGSKGVDSSDTNQSTNPGILKYGGNAGDYAFLDIWTYTVNTVEADVKLDIVIQELNGYDPITLKGLVFFDRDKNACYDLGSGDFPLADVEVALDYYYCGTRWSVVREDPDVPDSRIIALTPVPVTHTEYDGIDETTGEPSNPHEVIDYYYHHYVVRWEVDSEGNGAYYLYKYADTDRLHEGEALPVLDENDDRVTVDIEPYTYIDSEGSHTDYKVWIPVHMTTTTSNMGQYIFSGVLVNQNYDVLSENQDLYFNKVKVTVTNPDENLYILTTSEKHTGDFEEYDKGTEVQIVKLSDIEDMIKAEREEDPDASNFVFEVADVGYWFRLYEPPLTVKKIWGQEELSANIAQIEIEIEGFGVDDGQAYYQRYMTLTARDNWEFTPTDLPAAVQIVDENGDPVIDPVTGLQKEQELSYRIIWEQFEKDGTVFRATRLYPEDTVIYQKAETDSEGNIVTDGEGNIIWIDLGETPQPYESFILDLKNNITGDYLYAENWSSKSTFLTLTKRSNADRTLLLPGATFELLKLNIETSRYESIRTGYGGSYMITTDENGIAQFHGLSEGYYQLREVVAPTDYGKIERISFQVSLDENGQAYVVDDSSKNITDGEIDIYDDLDEPPTSGIVKYDQYDQLVSGAVFEVYPANSSFEKQGEAVATVTVGENGKAVFTTSDGSGGERPLYISELKERIGSNYFVMVETTVPAGYRHVGEAHLEIIGSGMSTYVECRNPFESGVWVGQKAAVYAPDTLQIADPEDYGKISVDQYVDENGVIQYATYNSGDGRITGTGTLFAVVLKRCGAEPDVTELTGITLEGWKPVYGDDIGGYTVMSGSSMNDILEAARASQAAYGEAVFTPNDAGVAMNAFLTNLPGESTRYFTYMYENGIAGTSTEPQYVVAYYYSTANSLEGATENNTVRVTSHGLAGEADDFRLYWATEIEIPDIVNALFVQKTDVYENAVDGTVFALYDAASDDSGNGYYIGKDGAGNTVYIRLGEDEGQTAQVYSTDFSLISQDGTYSVNTGGFDEKNLAKLTSEQLISGNAYLTEMFPDLADPGVITVTAAGNTYTIIPAKNGNNVSCMTVTHDDCTLVDENGSGHLRYLTQGKYYLKEIYVPAGYDLNYVNVEVAVTNQGVYANAGTENDGVRVGNGAGYLISTMNVFASIGEIDETLSYIIGKQRLYNGTEFFTADNSPGSWSVDSDADRWLYLQYAGTANSHPSSDEDYVLFDYVNRMTGVDTLRLWTETGWSDMAVFQDYEYGYSQQTTNVETKYTNLSGQDLSILFSGSTFVRVQDESVLDLQVTKVDSENNSTRLSGISFVMYKYDENGTKQYYHRESDETSWVTSSEALTTDEEGHILFQSLTNGTYYLNELKAPAGYNLPIYEVVITVDDGDITIGRSDEVEITDDSKLKLTALGIIDGRYVYDLTVPNYGGYEMPDTGGGGTLLFTLGGLLTIAASLVIGCGWGRRRERRGR